jgi:hypothetical protein
MRESPLANAVAAFAGLALVGAFLLVDLRDAEAGPPAGELESVAYACPASASGPTFVDCGKGYQAVRVETESTVPIYFGAGASFTSANKATHGFKRCEDTACPKGGTFVVEVNAKQLKCVSSASAVATVVMCAR